MYIVCDSTHLRQRSSGRFNGNFAVVGDRSSDLNGLAWHIGTLVQTHLTLDQTGSQAHGLWQFVIDVAPERFLRNTHASLLRPILSNRIIVAITIYARRLIDRPVVDPLRGGNTETITHSPHNLTTYRNVGLIFDHRLGDGTYFSILKIYRYKIIFEIIISIQMVQFVTI